MKILILSVTIIIVGLVLMISSFFMSSGIADSGIINFNMLLEKLNVLMFGGFFFIAGIILLAVYLIKEPCASPQEKIGVRPSLKKKESIAGIEPIKKKKKLTPRLMRPEVNYQNKEVNYQNKHGMTKLMIAARNIDVKAVQSCLKAGEDPKIGNSRDNGAKAISYAYRAQNSSMSEDEKRDYAIIRQILEAAEGS